MFKTVEITLNDAGTDLQELVNLSYHADWGEDNKHWYVVSQDSLEADFLNSDDLRAIADKLDELDGK